MQPVPPLLFPFVALNVSLLIISATYLDFANKTFAQNGVFQKSKACNFNYTLKKSQKMPVCAYRMTVHTA